MDGKKQPDVFGGGIHIATLPGTFDCDLPNACLVAAAPDLLESLREALKFVDAYRKNFGGDGDITAHNARRAIPKATGEP